MRVLMSRPEHFEILYEINPWMHIENQARTKRSMNQWQRLYDHYCYLGVRIELIEQPQGLPDFVFTANGGLVHEKRVILPSFSPMQRRPETPYFRKWFEDHGYECHAVKNYFEGEGDALFYKDTLLLGCGQRTVIESHNEIRKLLDVCTMSMELVDPRYYHLDTCFAPLGEYAIYYPPAFSAESVARLKALIPLDKLVELSDKEAEDFAANCMLIDDAVVSSCALKTFEHKLWGIGLDSNAFELDEFMKAGGSAKCLTLKLDNP